MLRAKPLSVACSLRKRIGPWLFIEIVDTGIPLPHSSSTEVTSDFPLAIYVLVVNVS